jgi:hypothetical protein
MAPEEKEIPNVEKMGLRGKSEYLKKIEKYRLAVALDDLAARVTSSKELFHMGTAPCPLTLIKGKKTIVRATCNIPLKSLVLVPMTQAIGSAESRKAAFLKLPLQSAPGEVYTLMPAWSDPETAQEKGKEGLVEMFWQVPHSEIVSECNCMIFMSSVVNGLGIDKLGVLLPPGSVCTDIPVMMNTEAIKKGDALVCLVKLFGERPLKRARLE